MRVVKRPLGLLADDCALVMFYETKCHMSLIVVMVALVGADD